MKGFEEFHQKYCVVLPSPYKVSNYGIGFRENEYMLNGFQDYKWYIHILYHILDLERSK